MTDLLDINLWLALVDKRHIHHPVAQAYWSQNGASQFAFCRMTMLGFLRLATSLKVVVNPKPTPKRGRFIRNSEHFPIPYFWPNPQIWKLISNP